MVLLRHNLGQIRLKVMSGLFAMEYVGCYVRGWASLKVLPIKMIDIEGKTYKRCINTVENAMFVNTIIINGYKR